MHGVTIIAEGHLIKEHQDSCYMHGVTFITEGDLSDYGISKTAATCME